MRAAGALLALTIASFVFAGCAARGGAGFTPPSGAGEPLADFAQYFDTVTKTCRGVRTLTAEASLSGRVGGQRLRGRLHLGLGEPNAIRIEGVAPFGPPAFILAAHDGKGTLLLPRDKAAVRDVDAADLIEALAGVKLSPDELRAVATGCVSPAASATAGRRYPNELAALTLADGSTLYARTVNGAPQIVAGRHAGLTIEYAEIVGGLPRRVRLRREAGTTAPADLTLAIAQVDTNTTLEPAAFTIDIPPDTRPLTLDELRRSGPLGESSGSTDRGTSDAARRGAPHGTGARADAPATAHASLLPQAAMPTTPGTRHDANVAAVRPGATAALPQPQAR